MIGFRTLAHPANDLSLLRSLGCVGGLKKIDDCRLTIMHLMYIAGAGMI